jgi:hypothetical protein
MRTSFHHQPEAQHPNFPLSTSGQADYPIFGPLCRLNLDISRGPRSANCVPRWLSYPALEAHGDRRAGPGATFDLHQCTPSGKRLKNIIAA